jgi:tRNA dimethylallyltransferase
VHAGQPLPPLIVICGPTATGKTRLSLELAERIPGAEIISADSRQVYEGMDIGTAKVSRTDRQRFPHHGLDLVTPDVPFTAADFARHAFRALSSIAGRGGVAILVGGTGLYIRTVADGLALHDTGRDPELRVQLEARLVIDGLAPLVAELQRIAPGVAAAVDLANPRRVVRALERVAFAGDRPPPPPAGYPAPILRIGLVADAATHAVWIEERARQQFEHGLLSEAETLRESYPDDLPAFSAIGYREAYAVLDGAMSVDEAVARAALRTRQFARRQRTWFGSEKDLVWFPAGGDAAMTVLASAMRLFSSAWGHILEP